MRMTMLSYDEYVSKYRSKLSVLLEYRTVTFLLTLSENRRNGDYGNGIWQQGLNLSDMEMRMVKCKIVHPDGLIQYGKMIISNNLTKHQINY